jgi:hypothetical protein
LAKFIYLCQLTSNKITNMNLYSILSCKKSLDQLEVNAVMNALLMIPATLRNLQMLNQEPLDKK